MEEELKCKVCGKLASEDSCFHPKQMLCNRHYLQMRRHGKIKNVGKTRNYIDKKDKVCCVCKDREHQRYYTWNNSGKYNGKIVCGKHYNQLLKKGYISDETPSEHNIRKTWSKAEEELFEELYKNGRPYDEICKILNRTRGSLSDKAMKLGLGEKYMRTNNPNYKAIYQDYDWCYERYINRRMTFEEMAEEAKTTKRTIEKWCADIHKLNSRTIKNHLHLTEKQYQLIIAGTLGDGHIDKREEQPMYIESHAEDEKEYLYYKYNVLKNLCNKEPSYIPSKYKIFNNKEYLCQPQYRLETKVITELKEIRDMKRIDKIKKISEYQLSLLVLDDASKNRNWTLCVAEWSDEEVDSLITICQDRFNIELHRKKDKRYLYFTSESSKIMDKIILDNILNEIDIVQKKVFKNKEINHV